MYAEIILPLPIYSTFTYEVPEEFKSEISTGARVLVQFGKKRYYTGIVVRTLTDAPEYAVKPIMAVLDNRPVVKYPQLKLWEWIAEYYLCSVGEVFKAAVPTGLKPESETFVTLNPDYSPTPGFKMNERQASIIQMLERKGRMRIADIEAETKFRDCARVINTMLEPGLLEIDEKVIEKYRPKRETYVTINAPRDSREKMHELFDKVSRARNQEKALIAWLDLSGWLNPTKKPREVTRKELLELSGVSPGVLKAMTDKGIFSIEKRSINRFNPTKTEDKISLSPLTPRQKDAYNLIVSLFNEKQVTLLHGVTGSGKTEIYSHLISDALNAGKQVLYLVPEISLTTQLTDRLRKVFGERLLIYHSKFSDSERVDIWNRLLSSNEPMVILGVRSSVFLPFSNLGLVIVDEEHESSYKQYDPAPRYNARDTAIVLAGMHSAKVLLGSATPSVETYYKALEGKYGLISLSERYAGSVLPDVEIVDIKVQRKKKLMHGMLSEPLRHEISDAMKENLQAIVFQNRRGFAPVVVCKECGWTPKCENCDVSLVYHKKIDLLRCHYCGFSRPLPNVCPACGLNGIETYGYGTERIAEEIQQNFPSQKIVRMDLDTTRNKDAYQEIIENFASHQTDILVGTQMVTKGLDFERVNVVGVINADTLLNFPDFRSSERAFNMLEQVAGRAGRREREGNVVIQTTQPDHPVLNFVKAHDFKGFYDDEIEFRRKYNYPPFTRIINIFIKNKDSAMTDRAAVAYALELRKIFGNRVLGPERPFVSRVALWYLQQIMLKIESGASMKKVKNILRGVYESMARLPEMKGTMIYFDVDPA